MEGTFAPANLHPMYGEQHPSRLALREARETTIDQLSESFARDELSLDEFEQRVDRAYAAASPEEVQSLVSDLTIRSAPRRVQTEGNPQKPDPETAIVAMPAQGLRLRDKRRVGLAIFGNVERHGRWTLEPDSEALAVFGNVELDLREAVIAEGVTELHVRAIFGNVEIIVPPTISVDCHGLCIFGNFEGPQRAVKDDGTPVLRITGKAIFGNVEVSTGVRGHLGRAPFAGRFVSEDPESSSLPPLTPRRLPPEK